MTTKTTLRRLALGAGVAVGGGILAVLFMSTPARADEGPQRPGGVLGTVVEVVDEVLPEPTKAAEPDPEPTREPEPAREPTKAAEQAPADEEPAADDSGDNEPEPEAPPADPIGDAIEDVKDGLEQVVEPVKEVVEVVTDPLPTPPVVVVIPAPVVVTPPPTPAPTVTPEPTQPATEPATVDSTEPAADELPEQPAVEAPDVDQVDLPVVGPVAGSNTLLPGLTPDAASSRQDREPQCTGDHRERTLDDVRKDARSVATGKQPRDGDRADPGGPGKPCPAPAPPTDRAMNATAGPSPAGAHGEQYAATAAGLTWPALARLQQLRARGDIPAGRSTHVEPGPA